MVHLKTTRLVVSWLCANILLVPYFCLLTLARVIPSCIGGGMASWTRGPFPAWSVLVFFWPLTFTQLYLLLFWSPLVLLDYDNYLRIIGEKSSGCGGKAPVAKKGDDVHYLQQQHGGGGMDAPPSSPSAAAKPPSPPRGVVQHGVITYLYTRYLEHPLVTPDFRKPTAALLRAAGDPDSPVFLRPDLPPRQGDRPTVMQGLPQRQVDQLASEEEAAKLDLQVFKGMFQGSKRVEVSPSVLEGTGALGLRWKDSRRCRPEVVHKLSCEFAHQHSLDGSWHMLLSAKDALMVLQTGWGEIGPPLAAQGLAPPSQMLIYAPRDEEERDIFLELLHASLCYTGRVATTPPQQHQYYRHRHMQ